MKKVLTLFVSLCCTLLASAQTDVTKYFLSNYGFDTGINYPKSSSTAVAQELLEVEGWTAELSANYTIVGTYEFGTAAKFNGASVPSKGFDGEAGAGIAISTGWDQTFKFFQTVTLPAGTYTVTAPSYNGCAVNAATSLLAWIPNSGTSVSSKVTSYAANAWTEDKITFTLTKTTTGKIQFGMKAASGGSANSAKIVIDYIKIVGENIAVDKTALNTSITSAKGFYNDGTGNGAAALKTAIDAAQSIYDNANASLIDVLEGKEALEAAIMRYRTLNISEENPLNVTSLIVNPSFEKSGSNGWTNVNLASQTNSSFTKKAGATYMEKWVGSGSVGSASISQVISNIPNGVYKLTVAAQNLNQANTTAKNKGVVIYAGDQETAVYTPNDYSVIFTSIAGEIEIGFKAENAGGNWIAVDNFRLYQIGTIDNTAIVAEIQRIVNNAKALQSNMMSKSVADALQAAIEAGTSITEDSEDKAIQDAKKALDDAINAASQSIEEYNALNAAIATATKTYNESKNGAAEFKAELDKANELANNPEAKSNELSAEIDALAKAELAFNLANATAGTGTAVKVTETNHYVPTGSTEALMRATMTGSNIIERGVCWSTEHEPTVLDNRTTEFHELRGNIYHVRNLQSATVYYLRPYVMNKTYQVAYGDEVKIVTHPKGTCVGTWNEGAPDEAANARCRNAIRETIEYFNQWTGIKGFHLTGNYGSGTPTADCSYGGWMRIGPNAGNQAIGTVIHETGHGVGVGTSARWSDTNVHSWKWFGREANQMYSFLENKEADPYYSDFCMVGDGTHGWGSSATYDWFVNGADKDKHLELQYLGGCCLLYAMFIDGLCPTTSYTNGLAGYTYNFDDSKKYYLMSKNAERGLGEALLYQRTTSAVGWKPMFNSDEVSDSAAWTMEYVPSTGMYRFKNVMSGKYLTHSASGSSVTVKNASSPSTTEAFQLMPDRTDVTIGIDDTKIKTHGYWLTWEASGNKAMQANVFGSRTGYGSNSIVNFNYADTATDQQWIIISEDELEAFKAAYIATGIKSAAVNQNVGDKTVVGIFSPSGASNSSVKAGINIIKYSDGTTQKIYVK